jgi:hypothetical protein
MAIPPFDEHGFLPVGVHECAMEEIKERFGSFRTSDRRPELFGRLSTFVLEARAAGFGRALIIDGSFTTEVQNPNDIDLVLVLQLAYDLSADLSAGQYNLVSRRRVQRRFGFDIVVVREETAEYEEAIAFFAQVRHKPALRKGMLRLPL